MISTPSAIRRQWEEFYEVWGIPTDMQVPEPNFNQAFVEEMAALEVPRVPIYVHPDLSLLLLSKVFPAMRDPCPLELVKGVVDKDIPAGWLFPEGTTEASNRETNEGRLQEIFDSQGANGATEVVFLIFGQYHMETHDGCYPYQKTSVRLLGSRCHDVVVIANFNSLGDPRFDSHHYQRSSGVFGILGGLSVVVPS